MNAGLKVEIIGIYNIINTTFSSSNECVSLLARVSAVSNSIDDNYSSGISIPGRQSTSIPFIQQFVSPTETHDIFRVSFIFHGLALVSPILGDCMHCIAMMPVK